MSDQSRKALHAYLSADSHEQWHAFAADFGVSVSAILEVLGKHLGSSAYPPHALLGDARIHDFVADARCLDATRRRRTRARGTPLTCHASALSLLQRSNHGN